MSEMRLPRAFVKRLKAVTKKRPRTVIDHILKHGFITTEELRTTYGYNHPPRAARDVREEGVPLETFRVRDSQGRMIGAYRFADPAKARFGRLRGRTVFPKSFKEELVDSLGSRCSVCGGYYENRYLQIDHRVPYEVSGDAGPDERDVRDYMLLCASCNRAKSWSCEHCINWLEERSPEVCTSCYWASPEAHKHIALNEIRRLDVLWSGNEIEVYEKLRKRAEQLQSSMPEYVKKVLKRHVRHADRAE